MGYNRSKSKTSRRVKRAKTNKRNIARKQTFRKSRRVNRGGKGPQKRSHEGDGYNGQVKQIREGYVPDSMEDKLLSNKENNNNDPHNQAQIEHEKIKDAEIEEKKKINMRTNRYREPLYPGNTEVVYVNQTPQLDITKRQYEFEDMMDAEDPNRPEFGGKKKRATRRK
jgi:hypothetical protein